MLSAYLLVGEVLRPQGIKGQVKIKPYTDDPERFEALDHVFIEQEGEYLSVPLEDVQVRPDGVYARLQGAPDRNAAEVQRGWQLYVDRAHARELDENETFICDLIGCAVVDLEGQSIGKITDVLQPGGNDVYVIRTPMGEMLLPALRHVVPEVDVEKGIVRVDASRLPEVAVSSWE